MKVYFAWHREILKLPLHAMIFYPATKVFDEELQLTQLQ